MSLLSEEVYAALEPLQAPDAASGYPLRRLIEAIATMGAAAEEATRTADGSPAWSPAWDINRCPTWLLPFLGQSVGVKLGAGLSDEQMRVAIAEEGGWKRGRPAAVIAAVQATLTGSKRVRLIERANTAWNVEIVVSPKEAPPAAGSEGVELDSFARTEAELSNGGRWIRFKEAESSGTTATASGLTKANAKWHNLVPPNAFFSLDIGANAAKAGTSMTLWLAYRLLAAKDSGYKFVIKCEAANLYSIEVIRTKGELAPVTIIPSISLGTLNVGDAFGIATVHEEVSVWARRNGTWYRIAGATDNSYPEGGTLVITQQNEASSLRNATLREALPIDPVRVAAQSQLPGGITLEVLRSDLPLIDEGTRTIDASTNTIDAATISDIT